MSDEIIDESPWSADSFWIQLVTLYGGVSEDESIVQQMREAIVRKLLEEIRWNRGRGSSV